MLEMRTQFGEKRVNIFAFTILKHRIQWSFKRLIICHNKIMMKLLLEPITNLAVQIIPSLDWHRDLKDNRQQIRHADSTVQRNEGDAYAQWRPRAAEKTTIQREMPIYIQLWLENIWPTAVKKLGIRRSLPIIARLTVRNQGDEWARREAYLNMCI